MKNKIIRLTLVVLCFLCITGCETKNETDNKTEEIKYTYQDLLITSKYKKIDNFINTLFTEINFDEKITHDNSNEQANYITHAYINSESNTVFTFFFNYSEEFIFVNIIYDKNVNSSIELARKMKNKFFI